MPLLYNIKIVRSVLMTNSLIMEPLLEFTKLLAIRGTPTLILFLKNFVDKFPQAIFKCQPYVYIALLCTSILLVQGEMVKLTNKLWLRFKKVDHLFQY